MTEYNTTHLLNTETSELTDLQSQQTLNLPYRLAKLDTYGTTYLLLSEQNNHQFFSFNPKSSSLSVIKELQNLGSIA
jgi:hypothetical protein